ncbi:MAG: hypothetical protein JW816_02520 [Candidatus Buchananbacteria bacterium]|nr:hypothetical protein [Candidatus Buchananbacteria bacterium]
MPETLAPWDQEQFKNLEKEKIEDSLTPKEGAAKRRVGENLLTREINSKKNIDQIIDQIHSEKFSGNTKKYLESLNPDERQTVVAQAHNYIELFGSENYQDKRAIFAVDIISSAKKI